MSSFPATWAATRALGSISTRAGGKMAARLWFTPWPVPIGDKAQVHRDRWLRHTSPLGLDFEGARLAGWQAGDGPTVLLVHGWGDTAASLGAFIDPLVDAGYRVVGFDLPAHGGSGTGQTNLIELAAAVRAIGFEIGPLHAVVAHSMGGATTSLAMLDGLEVERVVLLSPAGRLDRAVDVFKDQLRLPRRAVQGLKREIERRFGADVWERFAAVNVASQFQTPALVIHDRQDKQVKYADGLELAEA